MRSISGVFHVGANHLNVAAIDDMKRGDEMKIIKPKTKPENVWLDGRAQAARAGKSWLTLSRWMNDPAMNYPRPERYFGKTPVTRLETIEAWEKTLPTKSPFKGIARRPAPDRPDAA
jgi:hypothetical protein